MRARARGAAERAAIATVVVGFVGSSPSVCLRRAARRTFCVCSASSRVGLSTRTCVSFDVLCSACEHAASERPRARGARRDGNDARAVGLGLKSGRAPEAETRPAKVGSAALGGWGGSVCARARPVRMLGRVSPRRVLPFRWCRISVNCVLLLTRVRAWCGGGLNGHGLLCAAKRVRHWRAGVGGGDGGSAGAVRCLAHSRYWHYLKRANAKYGRLARTGLRLRNHLQRLVRAHAREHSEQTEKGRVMMPRKQVRVSSLSGHIARSEGAIYDGSRAVRHRQQPPSPAATAGAAVTSESDTLRGTPPLLRRARRDCGGGPKRTSRPSTIGRIARCWIADGFSKPYLKKAEAVCADAR